MAVEWIVKLSRQVTWSQRNQRWDTQTGMPAGLRVYLSTLRGGGGGGGTVKSSPCRHPQSPKNGQVFLPNAEGEEEVRELKGDFLLQLKKKR